MFLKKVSFIFLASLLLLTGCVQEAAILREAVVQSLDKQTYDFKGSFALTGDFNKLPEMMDNSDSTEPMKSLFQALTTGITYEGSIKEMNKAKMVLSLKDDKVLRDNGLWGAEQQASIELLTDVSKYYVKTPQDSKYLLNDSFSNYSGEDSAIDQQKIQAYQERLNERTRSFMKRYVAKYGYKLSAAKNLGTETVTLPNGQSVKTTHVTITFDTKELINMILYTLKDSTTNAEVKSFAIDLFTETLKLGQETAGDQIGEKMTDAEIRKEAEKTITEGLVSLQASIGQLEKTYTLDQMVAQAKAVGLDNFSMKLDYYIDAQKMPVRGAINMSVTVSNLFGLGDKPLTFGMESEGYAWNFGKATPFSYPTADQVVTIEQIKKDKTERESFAKNGMLRPIVEDMLKESGTIVFDLMEKATYKNNELVSNVRPYQVNGTTMVPFRFIGESMGADIHYNSATRTATFSKDGKQVELVIGSKQAKVNGQIKKLEVPVTSVDGSLYVPLRFLSEELGAEVIWLGEVKQAIIQYEITP